MKVTVAFFKACFSKIGRPNWVKMDISGKPGTVAFIFNQMCLEPPLEDVAGTSTLLITADTKRGQETLHEPTKVRLIGLQV